MANSFSLLTPLALTISRYVSKSGHDSNDGTTKDTPLKSIPAGQVTQIGAGIYDDSETLTNATLIADGKVILKNKDFTYNTAAPIVLINLELIDCTLFLLTANSGVERGIINCKVKNSANIAVRTDGPVIRNNYAIISGGVYINCSFARDSRWAPYDSVIFIDSIIDINQYSKNFYADPDSVVYVWRAGVYFDNCNIEGVVSFHSALFTDGLVKTYVIQDQLTGTPQDNGYNAGVKWLTEANLTADGANFSVTGVDTKVATCINRNPLFNNPGIEDFTLQSGSPHIGRANDGISNIGGTEVAISIINTDNNGGSIEVLPSAQIDTSTPESYILSDGETEGFIDYIINIGNIPLTLAGIIEPNSLLEFDSDIVGGLIGNRNVPDSFPLTASYPTVLATTADGPDTSTLKINGHGLLVGAYVRVNGEDREITAIPDANTITVASAFRAIITSGTSVQASTETILSSLRPNRLTYLMRTSKSVTKPSQNSDWDNDVNPVYNQSGVFLVQEWFKKPVYVVDAPDVYGGGDTNRPTGLSENEIQATWLNIRVYLRNDYKS